METVVAKRSGLVTRSVVPVGVVLIVTLITSTIYEHSWKFKSHELLFSLTALTNILMFLSIFFSAFVIYAITFYRGAGARERIIASLVPLLIWMLKETVGAFAVFSFGESLYFVLNPMFLFLILFTFFEMGLCDPFCRWRLKKRSQKKVRVFSLYTVGLLGGSFLALFLYLATIMRIGMFYFETYKQLFI